MAAAAVALIFGGIATYCYVQSQNLTVVLVSGLDRPYAVILNGTTHQLGAMGAEVLQLPEGEIRLQDAPGSAIVGTPRSFTFATPFFDHLGEKHVAIINPDRVAVLLNEEVRYYNSHNTAPAKEDPSYSVLANEQSYFIAKPDFVLETPPASLSMPADTTRVVKLRLEQVTKVPLLPLLEVLQKKLGYQAARDHLMALARYRTDEPLLTDALQVLHPEDHRAFFLIRLQDRPVLLEWHRFYQQSTAYTNPDADLVKEYRNYLQADPTNGALQYLLGRITPDRAESRKLFRQALAAQPPCAYAFAALGFDAMADGNYTEALKDYLAAESTGLDSQAITHYRLRVYWGLRRFDALRSELQKARKAKPFDLELAADEISVVLASGEGLDAALKITCWPPLRRRWRAGCPISIFSGRS